VTLTDLSGGFRDDLQRRRAQAVIQDRLADDRKQDECRYLMRFCWQLLMTYQEISEQELQTHVAPEKLEAVEALIKAIRTSPDQIDVWIASAENAFPTIHDRSYDANS
jgi:hypothetical protein